MWYRIFPEILTMSMTGSIAILTVLLARQLLRRAPKVFSYILWGFVLLRLLCPVAPTSELSLMNLLPDPVTSLQSDADQAFPSAPEYIVVPDMMSPGTATIPDSIPEAGTNQESVSHVTYEIMDVPMSLASPRTNAIRVGTILWLTGAVVLLAYSLRSLWKLCSQLEAAFPLRDNIYLADYITTPFVFGLLRPRIYLPSSLPEEQQDYILLHEQHHIRRLDHLWKLLAFTALCIHWFNPLVWLAFVLAGKDMEMSCDEAVLRRMGDSIRADYSASLLTLSTGQRIYAAMPLAFGEGDTKDRIHHVLSWKKPRTWIVLAAILACLILAVSLSTDPSRQSDLFGARYTVKEILYDAPQISFTYTVDTAPEVTITSDHVLLMRNQVLLNDDQTDSPLQWQTINGLYEVDYSRQELYALFDPLYCNVHEKLDQVKQIYRANPFNISAPVFFLVMETKNGDVLLARGYGREGEDEQHVLWLFQLEQQSGIYKLDSMDQALKDKYGKDAEYFSLYQCDTTPDTILLGFQVGTGSAKGPSAVGYAAFRYDKATDDYLLAHSEVLPYQVTGLYPVKLSTVDNDEVNLQIVLSTREDLAGVQVTSPLKDHADFRITQEVIGGPGGPSMLVFQCPDDLTLNTLNIHYLYDWNDSQDPNGITVELGHYNMITDTDDDTSEVPTFASFVILQLQEDNVFTFTFDPLSSYLNYGHYTIQDDRLIAITDDGRHQYCFQILNQYTLRFLQSQSSEVSPIDERLGTKVTDGALFQHPQFHFSTNTD